MASSTISVQTPSLAHLQTKFLAVLPRIEEHARVYFRHLSCAMKKADCAAETIALAWKWFVRCAEKGKDATQFASALASLAARSVNSGRRLSGKERVNDVLSPVAQRRHGFRLESLPISNRISYDTLNSGSGQKQQDALEERLCDNTRTPVPDQVTFRIDFPQFLRTLSKRDRRMVLFLSMGNRAKNAATKFGLTEGRVTQLRQAWCREWRAGQGDLVDDSQSSRAGERQRDAVSSGISLAS